MYLDLTNTPKPTKSSHLAIPPSPFSPQFPITPPATPPRKGKSIGGRGAAGAAASTKLEFLLPPPPQEPLHWLWQCHLCNRCYRLGVTRRCLNDGHYFCSGMTTVKRSKKANKRKVVRHKACASEFDYQAWKTWGEWRRGVVEQIDAAVALERLLDGDAVAICLPGIGGADWMVEGVGGKGSRVLEASRRSKDCWNRCDYPSECRWGQQQDAVESPPRSHSPTATAMTVTMSPACIPATIPEEEPMGSEQPPTSFDEIVSSLQVENHPSTDLFASTPRIPLTSPEEETKPSMEDLLSSARRRKRRSTGLVASPLASNPPEHTSAATAEERIASAFDDFELELRRSIGRAGAFVSSVVSRRHSAITVNSSEEDDRIVVKGLRVGRRKSGAGIS